jgi:hypothetical protein
MHRNLPLTAVLGLAAVLAAPACKPDADTFDAGCYPAVVSTPVDAGVDAGCTPWSGGCDANGTTALLTSINNAFATNGTCLADTDCGLYTALGSQFKMQCYESFDIPPLALAQRGVLDQQLQAIICGFCNACGYEGDGGGVLDSDPEPPPDAGNCTEVSCLSGQCNVQTFQD